MTTYLSRRVTTVIVPVSTTRTIEVYGKGLFRIANVYLSGSPYPQSTLQNPFSASPKLSATYPSFNAVKLLSTDYTTDSEGNYLSFTMLSAAIPGSVDIIVENLAGYGKLTQYVIKELYTSPLTLPELRPWSDGIQVTN
jgi:hypothetical protein